MDYQQLIEALDDRRDYRARHRAIDALIAAGERAKPAMLLALTHPAWRVRHGVLRGLDHTVVDDETRVAVVARLDDPHRKVRHAALHLLACDACKPDGFCGVEGVDVEEIVLRLAEGDRSVRVRTAAVLYFWPHDVLSESTVAALRAVLDRETNVRLRLAAARAIAWNETAAVAVWRERLDAFLARVDALIVGAVARTA